MKEYKLNELLDKLIGHFDIACETNYDKESENNLDTLEVVGYYVLDALYNNAEYNNDYRGSANCIAKKSIKIAKEYKKYIDSILEFDKEEENVKD